MPNRPRISNWVRGKVLTRRAMERASLNGGG